MLKLPCSAPKRAASVDCIAEGLPSGTIAFNTPEQMMLDKPGAVALRLSLSEPVESLTAAVRAAIGDTGALVGTARVRFSRAMTATLEGQGFDITPDAATSHPVAVSETKPTEWVWQVTPRKTGDLFLSLSLDAILSIDGREAPRTYRAFFRIVHVTATWPQLIAGWVKEYWGPIAFVLTLLGALWKAVRGRRKAQA